MPGPHQSTAELSIHPSSSLKGPFQWLLQAAFPNPSDRPAPLWVPGFCWSRPQGATPSASGEAAQHRPCCHFEEAGKAGPALLLSLLPRSPAPAGCAWRGTGRPEMPSGSRPRKLPASSKPPALELCEAKAGRNGRQDAIRELSFPGTVRCHPCPCSRVSDSSTFLIPPGQEALPVPGPQSPHGEQREGL